MRVILTRDSSDCEALALRLEQQGLTTFSIPLIEVRAVACLVPEIRGTDCLVFTSPRAVKFWQEMCAETPSGTSVYVQGPRTASAVRKLLGRAPECFQGRTSDEMGEWLVAQVPRDVSKLILVRSGTGRTVLRDYLNRRNFEVTDCVAYETVSRALGSHELSTLGDVSGDLVTFFSPSAVKSWVSNGLSKPGAIASFGPITSKEITAQGWNVTIQATSNDTQEFERNIVSFVGSG